MSDGRVLEKKFDVFDKTIQETINSFTSVANKDPLPTKPSRNIRYNSQLENYTDKNWGIEFVPKNENTERKTKNVVIMKRNRRSGSAMSQNVTAVN